MKLNVGGKYRMRNYPAPYEYVKIIGSKGEYDEVVFWGNIISKNFLGLETRSELCEWGTNGNWYNGKDEDCNDLVEEIL